MYTGKKEYLKEDTISKNDIVNLLKEEIISKDGKAFKEVYNKASALDFLLTFKDEINEIPEVKKNGIIDKYIKNKVKKYSNNRNIIDIYDIVNFVKYVGEMQGENKQQDVFEIIFKDLDLYPLMEKYFDKNIYTGEVLFNHKTTFFVLEMMSEIRSLAKNEKTISIIMPKFQQISKKIRNPQFEKTDKIKEALDSNNKEELEKLIEDEKQLFLKIDGKSNLFQYVLEKFSGENLRKNAEILVKKYEWYNLPNALIDLAQGKNINEEDQKYVFDLILKENLNINMTYEYGKTALHYAVENENENMVNLLLKNEKYKVDINKIDRYGKTVLHYAVDNGNENMINLLLKYGADINKGDKDGVTPLMKAIENLDIEMVEFLLKNGADINKEEKNGVTPLMKAIGKVYDEETEKIVKLLIDNGADINKKAKVYTPLTLAYSRGNRPEMIYFLLENGADVNLVAEDGSLLHGIARFSYDKKLAKLLLEKGADINIESGNGETPLMFAIGSNNKTMIKFLIENGADINKGEKEGVTPLIFAVADNNKEMAKLLLENGADINKGEKDGVTPLIYAINAKNKNMVKMLIENGADVNKKDELGNTPIGLSIKKGEFSISYLLIKQGVKCKINEILDRLKLNKNLKNKTFKVEKEPENSIKKNIYSLDEIKNTLNEAEQIMEETKKMQAPNTTILTENDIDNLWNTTLDKVNSEEIEQNKKTEEKEKQSKEVLNNNYSETKKKDKKNDIPKNFGGF